MRRLPVFMALLLACGGNDGTDPVDTPPLPDVPDVADAMLPDLVPDVAPDVLPDLALDVAPDAAPDLPPDVPPAKAPETLGGDRPAALFAPWDWTPDRKWPLVIVLHGYSANGTLQSYYLGLPDRLADRALLLVPEGTVDRDNYQFWNAWPSCCDFWNTGVDDVGYLAALIDEAVATAAADPDHVVLVGHSNGGFLSFRLACEIADRVAGLAAIAGSMSPTPDCTPSRPVSVLDIHGTVDDSVPYDGRPNAARPSLSAGDILAKFAGIDACAGGPADDGTADYDDAVAGAETTRTTWTGCAEGRRIDHWKMAGSGHVPGFNPAFQDDLVAWLLAQGRGAVAE